MNPKPHRWEAPRKAAEANVVLLTEAASLTGIRHEDSCVRIQGAGIRDCYPDVRLHPQRIRAGG